MSSAQLEPGSVVEENQANGSVKRYRIGNVLGKGGFAMCYEMTSADSFKTFAGKVVCKASLTNSMAKAKLINEIRIHRSLFHVGIVRFHHFFEDALNVYILLERCRHQTLIEMVKTRGRLTLQEARYFLWQILDVLEYFREQKVIHRDLKLGNIFLHDNLAIKIGDFGLAAKVQKDADRKTTICGTPNYIAPEILSNTGEGHSFPVDVWSFGVIAYTLVIGRPPYETGNVTSTYERIKLNRYSFPSDAPLHAAVRDLISRLLVLDPLHRASLQEIKSHVFFTMASIPISLPLSALTTVPCDQPAAINDSAIAPSNYSLKENCRDDRSNGLKKQVAAQIKKSTVDGVAKRHRLTDLCIQTFYFEGQEVDRSSNSASIRIRRILNYSHKYGMGYLLSNDSVGIHFNDDTKIVTDRTASYFQYLSRSNRKEYSGPFSLALTFCDPSFARIPSLEKKLTLLRHFHKTLLPDGVCCEAISSCNDHDLVPLVFAKKWISSNRSILFALTNGTVQVMFTDKSELVIDSMQHVHFKDKAGRTTIIRLDDSDGSNWPLDFSRRLDYVESMMKQVRRTSKSPSRV